MTILLIFIFFLFLPLLVFRTILRMLSRRVLKMHPFVRVEKKFHHAHFGLGVLTVGILSMFLSGVTGLGSALTGLGLGMVLDQFLVSLSLPEPEPETTIQYLRSFWPSFFLLLGLSLLFIFCYFVVQGK